MGHLLVYTRGVTYAAAILHLRSRLAWSRPPVHAPGCRHGLDRSGGYVTAGCASDRTRHSARACHLPRNTSTHRFMDAHRGGAGGGHGAVGQLVAPGRSVDPYPAGNPGCRLGPARTWRLVGGCSPFWVEAHRHSRSAGLILTTLGGCSLAQESRQASRYSGENDCIGGCRPAKLVPQSVTRMKARCRTERAGVLP